MRPCLVGASAVEEWIMQEIEAIERIVGPVDAVGMVAQLVLVVQSTLVIFFVVSPLMGAIMWRTISNRVNFVLAWSAGVVVVLLSNYALTDLLRRAIPESHLPALPRAIISASVSICIGLLLAVYIAWVTKAPGMPIWVKEHEARSDEDLMPFEIRRREWMKRRDRSQHRH